MHILIHMHIYNILCTSLLITLSGTGGFSRGLHSLLKRNQHVFSDSTFFYSSVVVKHVCHI